jgi:hypothetical protein
MENLLMFLSPQAALVRNALVAGTNGALTLVILLIAPLGLAAVLMNTLLVVAASFTTACFSDRIILFLQRHNPNPSLGLRVPPVSGDRLGRRRGDQEPR